MYSMVYCFPLTSIQTSVHPQETVPVSPLPVNRLRHALHRYQAHIKAPVYLINVEVIRFKNPTSCVLFSPRKHLFSFRISFVCNSVKKSLISGRTPDIFRRSVSCAAQTLGDAVLFSVF